MDIYNLQVVVCSKVISGEKPPQSVFRHMRKRLAKDSHPPKRLIQAFESGKPEAVEALLPTEGESVMGVTGYINKV